MQGQQFSPPQAGGQVQQEQLEVPLRLCVDQKPLDLLTGEHLHLPCFLGRQLASDGGVHADQPLLHCLLQSGPAVHVAGPHHAVGQPLAVVFRVEEPSALFQSGVELLQVILCQLIQRDVSQFRDNVPIDPALIARTGGGSKLRLRVVLIPEVHPLSEGHFELNLV